MKSIPVKLKAILDLGRIANLPTVWSNCLAAWWISTPGYPTAGTTSLWSLLGLLIGTSLLYSAGTTLNDAFDEEYDHKHRSERPIPSGTFTAQEVWIIGTVEILFGLLILSKMAGASLLLSLLLVGAIFAYNYLHKKSASAVWIMGVCRALLWLLPTTMFTHRLNPMIALWAICILAYIGGVTLTARAESKPNVNRPAWTVLLLLAPLGGWWIQVMFVTPLKPLSILFPIAFVAVLFFTMKVMREKPPASIGKGVGILLAAIPLIDALALSTGSIGRAVIVALALPLTRLLQRYFAST